MIKSMEQAERVCKAALKNNKSGMPKAVKKFVMAEASKPGNVAHYTSHLRAMRKELGFPL